MKNLKTNNRILSYLICFSLLAFVNISCNENNDLEIIEESEIIKKEALAEVIAKGGNIKRTRLKQRSNGLYRASIVVNKDNKDEVSTIALEIESKKGLIPETKTYYLDYFTTEKGKTYYTFADIKFENPDVVNQEVTIKVTLLDANKKPISTSTETITIEGLSKATISKRNRNPSIFFYPKSTRLGLTADIDNNEDNDVAEAAITIKDLQGNKTSFNVAPKKNNTIKIDFSFEKETISKQMNVTIILKDFYGDEISTFKEEVSLESDIKIGKGLLVQKSNGLYNALVSIKNDTDNQINSIALKIKKQEGIAEKTKIYILKFSTTENGVKYFTTEGVSLIESDINSIPVIIYLRGRDKVGNGGRRRGGGSSTFLDRRRKK